MKKTTERLLPSGGRKMHKLPFVKRVAWMAALVAAGRISAAAQQAAPTGQQEVDLQKQLELLKQQYESTTSTNRYASLKNITHETLTVHGNKDVVVGPINALILAERLPNAQLIVYSDSSHGAQYQRARTFLQHVELFLTDTHAQVSEPNPSSVRSAVASSE